ncbi:MAG: hypothetical protein ACLSTO_01175 [Bilophila wadsworthia]
MPDAFRIHYPLAEDGVIHVLRVLAEHAGDVVPSLRSTNHSPRTASAGSGRPARHRVSRHVRAAAPKA